MKSFIKTLFAVIVLASLLLVGCGGSGGDDSDFSNDYEYTDEYNDYINSRVNTRFAGRWYINYLDGKTVLPNSSNSCDFLDLNSDGSYKNTSYVNTEDSNYIYTKDDLDGAPEAGKWSFYNQKLFFKRNNAGDDDIYYGYAELSNDTLTLRSPDPSHCLIFKKSPYSKSTPQPTPQPTPQQPATPVISNVKIDGTDSSGVKVTISGSSFRTSGEIYYYGYANNVETGYVSNRINCSYNNWNTNSIKITLPYDILYKYPYGSLVVDNYQMMSLPSAKSLYLKDGYDNSLFVTAGVDPDTINSFDNEDVALVNVYAYGKTPEKSPIFLISDSGDRVDINSNLVVWKNDCISFYVSRQYLNNKYVQDETLGICMDYMNEYVLIGILDFKISKVLSNTPIKCLPGEKITIDFANVNLLNNNLSFYLEDINLGSLDLASRPKSSLTRSENSISFVVPMFETGGEKQLLIKIGDEFVETNFYLEIMSPHIDYATRQKHYSYCRIIITGSNFNTASRLSELYLDGKVELRYSINGEETTRFFVISDSKCSWENNKIEIELNSNSKVDYCYVRVVSGELTTDEIECIEE